MNQIKPTWDFPQISNHDLFFQISFFSTSPELSNRERFKYFSRTIPSDQYQTRVMVKIIERLNWSYISIVYEESNYGIKVGDSQAWSNLVTLIMERIASVMSGQPFASESTLSRQSNKNIKKIIAFASSVFEDLQNTVFVCLWHLSSRYTLSRTSQGRKPWS